MIDVKQLRVGNYISHVLHTAVKVTGVRLNPVLDGDLKQIFCEEEGWLIPEHCAPIPLTPEIIEKIEGCEQVHISVYTNRWDIEYNGRYIGVSQNKLANTWVITFGAAIELLKPELHLLQNVIFYNWGKDFQITLTDK